MVEWITLQEALWFSAVALSSDERTLAAADIAGLVQVWDFGV